MDYYNMFQALNRFLTNSGKNQDVGTVTRAYEYAASMHEGQYRKSGEDYVCHPIAVAQICANFGFDTDCICAALLHDVVEDCPDKTSLEELKKLFGERVASLVDGLTKLKNMNFLSKEEESIRNLRKMFFATSEDLGVMFIKLADRLHNMRTISSMPVEKQKTIALETMHVFAPVAQRLGIRKMKDELEELSFQCLDPIGYEAIKEDIERKFGESRDFIEDSQEKIKYRLNSHNIKFTAEGRVKTVASVHRKVFLKGKSLDEIYDFYAVRYIVNTVEEVYIVLGVVHGLFNHMQNRFKDYISTPKTNGYQSVHTTVINDKGIPLEVQIRTAEMHEIAEFGVASHWQYKTGEVTQEDVEAMLKWLKPLIEDGFDTNDPDEYLSLVKIDIYGDEIFAYTPKGDVRTFAKGATAVDFAYAIHSDIGNKMVGAKVNGVIRPIDAELESGKRIEIITSNSSKGPSRDWLGFVKTGEARNKIRQWFKREKRPENILVGREETERIFKQLKISFTEDQRNTILTNVSKREGFALIDDFYNAIGYGGVSVSKIHFKIREEAEKIIEEAEKKAKEQQEGDLVFDIKQIDVAKNREYSESTSVIIDGMENCETKLAKCCSPLPGDDICGFVTKGYGVSVHKAECKNYLQLKSVEANRDRLKTAAWNSLKIIKEENKPKESFQTTITLFAVKDRRLIPAIVAFLSEMRVPIHFVVEMEDKSSDNIILKLRISARDVEHLNYIINRLKTLKNIKTANRMV
jgi:GTP pyrophosphokinase